MAEKSLTELVKAMRRTGVAIQRPHGARPERGKVVEKGAGDKPTSFNRPLDSWEPRFRPPEPVKVEKETSKKEPEIKEVREIPRPVEPPAEETGFVKETRTAQRMKANKVRQYTLGVSVSAEEKAIFQKHVAGRNESFSAWARDILFRAVGRKAPVRPRRVD